MEVEPNQKLGKPVINVFNTAVFRKRRLDFKTLSFPLVFRYRKKGMGSLLIGLVSRVIAAAIRVGCRRVVNLIV